MAQFEYKVVPAPKRGLKAKGIKGSEAQFANALTTLMNAAAAEGWHYQRTDSLPCEERQGLTGRVTVFQNMLVFRRSLPEAAPVVAEAAALAVPVEVPPATAPAPVVAEVAASPEPARPAPDPRVAETLTRGEAEMPAAPRGPEAPAAAPHHAAE